MLDRAAAALVTECMRDAGFDYRPALASETQVLADARMDLERRYGVTSSAQAATYGYLRPPLVSIDDRTTALPPEAAVTLSGTFGPGSSPTTADTGSHQFGCLGQARLVLYGSDAPVTPFTLAEDLATTAWLQSRTDPGVRAAIRDWAGCMHEHGYRLDDPLDSGIERGTDPPGVVQEQEKVQATIDVRCKTSTDLVARWGEIEARIGDRLAGASLDMLELERHEIDSALARARAILVEVGTYHAGERAPDRVSAQLRRA